MGKFFIKFPISIKEKDKETETQENTQEFVVVNISEVNSSLVLRFHRPPHMNLPYRVENCLWDVSITYYQKVTT